MKRWRWNRLASITVGAVAGWAVVLPIWLTDSSRPLLVASGIVGAIALACTAALAICVYAVIAEDLQPRFFCKAPVLPVTVNTELGSLVGSRSFQVHPLRYWIGLSLNHRVFFGLMLFGEVDRLSFKEDPRP